ncbi:MAG: SRPBCC domain-containing protein [Vicinamibacterales bacterium]
MARPAVPADPCLDRSVEIGAAPAAVVEAFFDAHALASWWQVHRSVTIARPLGIFAIEWEPAPFRDELLGVLGGVFYGTVMDYRADGGFFLAEAYWLPPEGDPIGPMAFEVSVTPKAAAATLLRVRQTGYEDSPRWRRYYEIVNEGWGSSLQALKTYAEQDLAERLWGKWGRLTAAEREAKEREEREGAAAASTTAPGAPAVVTPSSVRPPKRR